MRIPLHSLIGATVLLLVSPNVGAQPVPGLTGNGPVYLHRGELREVTLSGANLGDADRVVVTDERALSADLERPDKPTPGQAKVKLTAGPRAALGTVELRVVTPLGVTPPVLVMIGQYPAAREAEPNNTPDQAQPVTLPAAVVGRVDSGGDVDCFRFAARKGEHLVFDVHAARIGSALDPVVVLLDAAGREQPRQVARRGGSTGGDPAIVFDPPADGDYTLQVRDVQYRGGTDYAYRIDAGTIPLVESIIPAGAPRGNAVRVRAVGHNLGPTQDADGGLKAGSSAERTLDLSSAEPGTQVLRFRGPAGLSNPVPFVVTDAPPAAEPKGLAEQGEDDGGTATSPKPMPQTQPVPATKPNTSAEAAARVELPAEVSGVLARPGDEHFYRFTLAARQAVTIEAMARQTGSPVDALLTLRDAKGGVVEQTNGAAEAEARISRTLDPGEYVVSVRDLTFGGGSGYGYRLSFLPVAAPPPDFAVRFLPDAPRLARGGRVKLWCDVARQNGYKGDVAVTVDGLPPGVTVTGGVATLDEQTSGVFTLSAAPDAALGSVPIQLRAVGTAGGRPTVRIGETEVNGRPARGAYLTVLDKPPFTVDALTAVAAAQLAAYPAEAQALHAKLNTATPALEKAQQAWEASVGVPIRWRTLAVTAATATGGTVLKPQPDGAILAPPDKNPERDTYTVVGSASLKQITALRLELLPDASLPSSGPGRNPFGNFVLNRLSVTVAPKSDPGKAQPVAFASAKATFEQGGYPAAGAIDEKPETGWAIFGGTGKQQTAWFFPKEPVPAGDVVLTVTLDQQFGQQHTLGRFRLAVSDDPDVAKRQDSPVPSAVADVLRTPADKRSPEQRAQLAAYYRSTAPELKADRARLDELRNTVGPLAEVARLEAALAAPNPAVDAERREWEQSVAAGLAWVPLQVTTAGAANGTLLFKEPDGSVSAAGPAPSADVYAVAGRVPLRVVTAVRLEALPDERYPGNGPGRADGNFVLTRFALAAGGGKAMDGKAVEPAPVALREARATFEQANFPVAATLDNQPETGWAVAPLAGVAHAATFFPRAPVVAGDGGATLSVTLEFASPKFAGFTLGRFRLWALGSADPAITADVPAEVQDVLKLPEDRRSDAQKAEVAAYYRTVSPALGPTRQRLAELKGKLPTFPLVVPRGKSATIPVPIVRAADFTTPGAGSASTQTGSPAGFAGPVQVTLEGFGGGRDSQTRQPPPIGKNFEVTPLTVDPNTGFAKLTVRPKGDSELGTRMVVLRAEAKIGDATYVQYSPAFPITVVEK